MKQHNVCAYEDLRETKKVFIASVDKSVISEITNAIGSDNQFKIEILSRGSDTLIKTTKESVDILIIDSNLPDVNSIEMVKSLHRMNVSENMKLILCADSDTLNEMHCMELF